MPDNAPVDDREIKIDFQAYNSEHMAMLSTTFGNPRTSSVLISASESGGTLQVSLVSDVSEDPQEAMTATIEYLEQVIELLRNGGTSEAAWAAQFATPYEPNSEQTTAPGTQYDLLNSDEAEIPDPDEHSYDNGESV